ncbi:MAG: NPCBM/NEW2 domain-containing protein [Fibrobacteres bacterium]|nr:NPCBM/NEW2 domain-containing protein [Fibrobacterota bacterium]
MNKLLNIVIMILIIVSAALSTMLGDAALSLKAGEFKSVTSLNTSSLYLGGRGTVFAFSNGGSWDPHTRQFLQIGAPHASLMRFIRYQESDNTWYIDSMPNSVSKDNWLGAHTYDHLTIDSAGVFYHIYWADGIAYRYDAPNKSWLSPLPVTFGSYGCLDYFPDLNGLLRFSRGNISLYRIHQNKWDTIRPGFAIEGDYESLAEYCPAGHSVIFGGGSSNARDFYRIDTTLVVTKLNPTPFDLRIGLFHIANDPVTGTVIGCTADSLYAYNHVTDKWYVVAKNPIPTGEMGAIPVSTYGVIAFITNSATPISLYKFANHAWSANPTNQVSVHPENDTLKDLVWRTRLKVYANIPGFGIDSGNTGVRFLGLEPSLANVLPDGRVFVNPMNIAKDTVLHIRVSRLGEWLPDTFKLPVKATPIKDSVRVSKLTPSTFNNGCWAGWARLDSTETIQGETFPNSLTFTATGYFVYKLNKQYSRFVSRIATRDANPLVFMVAVDGDTLFRSAPMISNSGSEFVSVNVEGADSIVLIGYDVNQKAWCSGGATGTWGTPMLFNTGISTLSEAGNSLLHPALNVLPNPFHQRVALSLHAPGTELSEFRIYNVKGQQVAEFKTKNTNSVIWDASTFSAGVYLVKARKGNLKFVQSITLGR